jgi:chromosome segregation ATPase
VSPTLARLIRKIAEKEASGASAADALSTAAGIEPGELATLHKQLQQAGKEATQWREKLAREHSELEQLKTAAAAQEKEKVFLCGELRKATVSLKEAQQETVTFEAKIAAFEARIAEQATILERRDSQLAHSLSLSSLDDCAITAIRALRDRFAQGDIRFSSSGEAEAVIANLGRPEMRNLSILLTRHTWRTRIIRWFLLRRP